VRDRAIPKNGDARVHVVTMGIGAILHTLAKTNGRPWWFARSLRVGVRAIA